MSKRNGGYFKPRGCGVACYVTQDNQNTMLHLLSLPFPKDKCNSLGIRLSVYIHPCRPSFRHSLARWLSVSFHQQRDTMRLQQRQGFSFCFGAPKGAPSLQGPSRPLGRLSEDQLGPTCILYPGSQPGRCSYLQAGSSPHPRARTRQAPAGGITTVISSPLKSCR